MNTNKLNHIALILDGNKRWAEKNKLSKLQGYKKGFHKIKEIVDYSIKINLPEITLFTLSSENFKRTSVNLIYEIILKNFSNLLDDIIKEKKIKIKIFGNRDDLPEKIQSIFNTSEELTKHNDQLKLNIAFNYGFKDEIKKVVKYIYNNKNDINFDKENVIREMFYLGKSQDPDILIGTGGYFRLSNFIMYNLIYTELFFTKTLWPDFETIELDKIINDYKNINRKYGL